MIARLSVRALTTFVLAFCSLAVATELEGMVSDVHDGDSLTVTTSALSYRVRLIDIDAPELAQTYGNDSRASLRQLCLFKQATVRTAGTDRYGRTLGAVRCVGIDVNPEQVRRGMAWVFTRYAPKHSPLYTIQAEARMRRAGVWQDTNPTEPWVWRQRHKRFAVSPD